MPDVVFVKRVFEDVERRIPWLSTAPALARNN
jgi:hypothetical protein